MSKKNKLPPIYFDARPTLDFFQNIEYTSFMKEFVKKSREDLLRERNHLYLKQTLSETNWDYFGTGGIEKNASEKWEQKLIKRKMDFIDSLLKDYDN